MRPVSEPSPAQRTVESRYAIRQLQRRPAPPAGSSSVSFFRALHYDDAVGDDITVNVGTATDVDWNYWENGDTSAFTPKTGVGGTPVLGTDLTHTVELNLNGRYIISWGVFFNTTFDGNVQMLIHDGDPIFGRPDTAIHGPATYGGNSFSTTGYYTQTISRIYTLLDPFSSGPWTPAIQTDVAQNSSASKTVTEAWLEIQYEQATFP